MSSPAGASLAPSSKAALYLAGVIGVYMVREPVLATIVGAVLIGFVAAGAAASGHPIARTRLRAAVVFVVWVFLMKLALDFVGHEQITQAQSLRLAFRQAACVSFLLVGALALMATTPARDVVEELETTRLPRSARLLVMMIVQYPRVLRDRYEQIVEAQLARGAEPARSIRQKITHGASVLLPVMQSELNALGERAGLIHLRGLDVDIVRTDAIQVRRGIDVMALVVAVAVTILSIVIHIVGR